MPLYLLYGCRECIKKCQFNKHVAAGPIDKDKGMSIVFGKPTYKCNSEYEWIERDIERR